MDPKHVIVGEIVLGLLDGHWEEMTLEQGGWKKWSSVLPGLVTCEAPEVVVPLPRPEDSHPTAGGALFLLYESDEHHPLLMGVFSSVKAMRGYVEQRRRELGACEGVTLLEPVSYQQEGHKHLFQYEYKSEYGTYTPGFHGLLVLVDSEESLGY